MPQPTNPLKSFNWSKLPDAKVQGTIWSELDDTKLYTNIELENIDKLFCAYQKNGVPVCIRMIQSIMIWISEFCVHDFFSLFIIERRFGRRSTING